MMGRVGAFMAARVLFTSHKFGEYGRIPTDGLPGVPKICLPYNDNTQRAGALHADGEGAFDVGGATGTGDE
jgi:hypothetical protein